MKKIFILLSAFIYSSVSFSQILITDPDLDSSNPLDCAANPLLTINFFDSGNNAANYGSNENETIVVCPDFAGGTSKLLLTVGVNAPFIFDVHASDTIFVYDGLNTSAPLLGKHNFDTDPFGFTHAASFAANPSGCLTIQFISDGVNEGAGWEANISCAAPPQPFEPHMAGYLMGTGSDIINPSDTGYSDICFGDSILFVGSVIFPYSFENTGVGYSQTNSNVTYEWEFSDGTQATGDSVWFKPPTRSGYIASLKITDSFPQPIVIYSKVRVSTIPSFAGVINSRDSICVGDTTVIVGGVTATDTAGVDPTSSSFQLGGTFTGLTWLPDGGGTNYTTTVNISGFLPGQTITSVSDIEELSITMEHTYLGDLEMLLECPNGTQVSIFNSYSPGIIPGGFGGGGTFLGDPRDDPSTTPGNGWEYRWSTTNATWGNFSTEHGGGNFINAPIENSPSMNPNGIYLPEGTFQDFATAGCPINGNWTITVRDNILQDDGYIFEWGILFDPVINPNNETYVPSIVSYQWITSATVLPGSPTDTFIVVSSNNPGTYGYTFEVADNFGCVYDTTVNVYFLPGPSIQDDTTSCAGQYPVVNTTSYSGGIWSAAGPGTAIFSPSNTADNPFVTVDVNGTYTLTYIDNQCAMDSSFDVYFADSVFVSLTTGADMCVGETATLDATSDVTEAAYLWNTNETSATIEVTDSGEYFVQVSGLCNSIFDTVTIETIICNIIAPTVVTPNGDGDNDVLFFEGLEYYPSSSLVIFNRWGNKIYESNDYQNDWNPTDVSDGTYFYILSPGGKLDSEIIKKTLTIFH